ncbi:MAG: hypothetical protein AMDU5_GPLC00010G0163 [Thermoplasmatales archaeon Gpl]|jgi:small-conductance mechanosensitive channel|nr:MAG: hypothetical protein AMDU5_GPLC00010G0163 [Thermoplasmatales archaeon Gpl]
MKSQTNLMYSFSFFLLLGFLLEVLNLPYLVKKAQLFYLAAYYSVEIFPIYLRYELSKYGTILQVIISLAIALVLIFQIRKMMRFRSSIRGNTLRYVFINYVINIIAYFIIFVVILSALGINIDSLLTSSILLAALIALAGQSLIGNILGGIMMEISKPFKPGDNVWIFPWSSSSSLMGLQLAVFFQKYYSKDVLYVQGIRGKVIDITMNYTKILADDGETINVPNAVVALGAFQLGPKSGSFAIRYEVPKHVTPDELRKNVFEVTESMGIEKKDQRFLVDETTLNTYLIMIEFPKLRDQNLRTRIFDNLRLRLEPMRIFPVSDRNR